MTEQKRAVILVSGGLDSTTVLAMALSQGYACYTLSFDYGQRHRGELLAALRGFMAIRLRHWNGAALVDNDRGRPITSRAH